MPPRLLIVIALLGEARAEPCDGGETRLVADLAARRLTLCREGRGERDYAISTGSAGREKERRGDRKTPRGTFALGRPRPSKEFHTFIPVGYPTAKQRREGKTGDAIGVHGPKRGWRWLGRLANAANWTRGCIALNRVEDIDAIAAWVREHRPSRIVIR